MARLQTRNRNNTNGHEHRNRMKKQQQQQQQPEPTNKRHTHTPSVLKSARAFELPFSHSISRVYNIISLLLICECAKRYMERTWDRIVCPRALSHSIRPPFPIRISKKKKKKRNNFTPFYSILFYCFYWRCESFECSRHQQPSPYRVPMFIYSTSRQFASWLFYLFLFFIASSLPVAHDRELISMCVQLKACRRWNRMCFFFQFRKFNTWNTFCLVIFHWNFPFSTLQAIVENFQGTQFSTTLFFWFHFWSEFFRTLFMLSNFFRVIKGKNFP